MWKKQGSWNFFHAKLIPNSSINNKVTLSTPTKKNPLQIIDSQGI